VLGKTTPGAGNGRSRVNLNQFTGCRIDSRRRNPGH
jgi:hypothetical protein